MQIDQNDENNFKKIKNEIIIWNQVKRRWE